MEEEEKMSDRDMSSSEQLLEESMEEQFGNGKYNCRVLLGAGGEVVDLLMPYQYRTLKIKQRDSTQAQLSTTTVEKLLNPYGRLENVIPFQGDSIFWGKVTYVNETDAVFAAKKINEDDSSEITVTPAGPRAPELTLTLTWCRRPIKGSCYITLENREHMSTLQGTRIQVGPKQVTCNKCFTRNDQTADIFLDGLSSDTTEDEVINGIATKLNIPFGECRTYLKEIKLPRKWVSVQENEICHVRNSLSKQLLTDIPHDSFKVTIKKYEEKTAFCHAYVKFHDPQVFLKTAAILRQKKMMIDGNTVSPADDIKLSVFIPVKIYDATKQDIDEHIEAMKQDNQSTAVQITRDKKNNVFAKITAPSLKKLVETKIAIERFIEGDTLDVESEPNIGVMFTTNGKQNINQFEKMSGAVISLNNKLTKVVVQGNEVNRQKAVQYIKTYIEGVGSVRTHKVSLSFPAGLMKALMAEYGTDLGKLKSGASLVKAHLRLREYEIVMIGDETSLQKAEEIINDVKQLVAVDIKEFAEGLPDCSACLCPIESFDIKRLRYCGHYYCQSCLSCLIQTAVNERSFPIQCISNECMKPLVIKDIAAEIETGTISRRHLIQSSIYCYVQKNQLRYRNCITADCEMVYKVTPDGKLFTCFLCGITICTTCHTEFHLDISCEANKEARENPVSFWIRDNPGIRKRCPKCNCGIEKTEGCNHCACRCGAHICWKCSNYFETSKECYAHLSSEHNSYV